MKRLRERKAARRSRSDPNQLGLFEPGPAPVQTAARASVPASTAKSGRSAIARKTGLEGSPAVLNARDTAAYLGISISTLKAWRRDGLGPPHTMLGARMVGYRVALLDAWLAARTTDPRPKKH